MLLGNYTSVSQTNGRFYGSFKFQGFELYAQDSWRVNRRLTLSSACAGRTWADVHLRPVPAELLRSATLRSCEGGADRYAVWTAERSASFPASAIPSTVWSRKGPAGFPRALPTPLQQLGSALRFRLRSVRRRQDVRSAAAAASSMNAFARTSTTLTDSAIRRFRTRRRSTSATSTTSARRWSPRSPVPGGPIDLRCGRPDSDDLRMVVRSPARIGWRTSLDAPTSATGPSPAIPARHEHAAARLHAAARRAGISQQHDQRAAAVSRATRT